MTKYIAFLDGTKKDGHNVVPMERLEYSFHTFSLQKEAAYEPTGDVVFESPNPPEVLHEGVERMIDAVLSISVTAHVMPTTEVRALLDEHPEWSTFPNIVNTSSRTRIDLENVCQLSDTATGHMH